MFAESGPLSGGLSRSDSVCMCVCTCVRVCTHVCLLMENTVQTVLSKSLWRAEPGRLSGDQAAGRCRAFLLRRSLGNAVTAFADTVGQPALLCSSSHCFSDLSPAAVFVLSPVYSSFSHLAMQIEGLFLR